MQHSLGSENNVFLYDNLFMLIISTSIKMRPWLQLLHNGVCMQLYQNLIYYTNSKEQFLEQYDNSRCYLSYQIILLRKKHKHLLELYEMLNLSSAKSIYLWTTAWSQRRDHSQSSVSNFVHTSYCQDHPLTSSSQSLQHSYCRKLFISAIPSDNYRTTRGEHQLLNNIPIEYS